MSLFMYPPLLTPTRKGIDITLQADYAFWFGDLNFRVEMDWHEAVACVKEVGDGRWAHP